MSEINIDKIGLKVGLEIHQQLATVKKLFCNCSPIETNEYTSKFSRKLRASKSELGEYDPAALFEKTKSKTMIYYSNPSSSCLVEQDEEPPHELNPEAKNTSLLISVALNSNIFSEIYPMRKMVIDGSNTSGFQRTMLVSQGGYLDIEGEKVGVQSICLEEDAAKLLQDKEETREFSLERLGIPLVEIALEPIEASPAKIRKIALTLGRLLRTTKKVTRGIGSIRQDVNVSIRGGGVIEVKGVQQLDQLEKVIEYESKRQHGLQLISEKLKSRKIEKISKENDVIDVTKIFKNSKSKIIKKAIETNSAIRCVRIKNFSGMFRYSPYEGIRLGKELGQLVRFFGIGGIFHSDELPNYGIEKSEMEQITKLLDLDQKDGYVIITGEKSKINFAIDSIINRIEESKIGVPAETRQATSTGETVFLRPRPGASRMYPETDIPPIIVTDEEIKNVKNNIPKSWDEIIKEILNKYKLNLQMANQIYDSKDYDSFEKYSNTTNCPPIVIANTYTSIIPNLERKLQKPISLRDEHGGEIFELIGKEELQKEAIEIIIELIMSGKAKSVEESIQKSSLKNITDEELENICTSVIEDNFAIIDGQGTRAISPLMGNVMKIVRGKASGEKVNQILKKKIQDYLNKK
ncbi:MAG TPA: Glu-tRNA(Gln) amidotransferase subunit GatE [Nitrosopumilus sp.]|nr:Glu-tRNA(Gln) amidotransferase subunit GatE [Nitrosopumilus sp.]